MTAPVSQSTTTKIVLGAIGVLALSLANLVLIYGLLASPPIHWWYDVAPPAGPTSVYVPGSGFSGVWFHLGALQSMPKFDDYEYFCYSSGCLSVVMAGMHMSVDDVYDKAYGIQQSWLAGNMSRFDIVEEFLQNLFEESDHDDHQMPETMTANNSSTMDEYEQQQQGKNCSIHHSGRIDQLLPKLKILVTSRGNGVEVIQPRTRSELVDALKQTTWIPFVTGEGVMRPDDSEQETMEEFYLDGGFSRMLHPECAYDLRVPNTWVNMMYTLHPGMSQGQVNGLWEAGRNFDHPLLVQ